MERVQRATLGISRETHAHARWSREDKMRSSDYSGRNHDNEAAR